MQEEKAQEEKEKQCNPATAASSSPSRQHPSVSMDMEEYKRAVARCGSDFGSGFGDVDWGLRLRLWLWVFVLIWVDLGSGAGAGAAMGLGSSLKSDVEALLEFRRGISEDPKGILNGWSHGNSPCHWYGVTCSQFRVRSLNLSNAGISGSVQAYSIISRMDTLAALVLRGNNVSGALDSSKNGPGLGVCSVSVLDLSDNMLSGGLDLGFLSSSCQGLVYLNLSFNSFTIAASSSSSSKGKKSFSLPFMRVLDLSHNSLSGETLLPQILSGSCDNLQHLDVSGNKLNGSIPLGIGSRCKQLVSLNLSANSLEAEIPADLIVSSNRCSNSSSFSSSEANCSGQPLLQVLDLSSNFLSGNIPLSLGSCKQLKVLNLSVNKLSGEIPAALGGLTSLEQLLISKNNLNGEVPEEMANSCAYLKELDLSYNSNLTGSIPWSFNSCTSLQTMDLSHNQLVGAFPEMLVSGLSSLRVLQLSFNNITGPVPISLTNSSNTLQILDLSSNRISGDIPHAICSPSSSLQKLHLANNLLTGPVPTQITNCQNLQSLDLSFNMLHGTIPAPLGDLPDLRDLVLWFNKLEGGIPQSICNSGSLETLILNSNWLTGPVPEALANCPNLMWISLSRNRLSGQIPPSLGRLKKLAILQLDSNSLSGPIPPELGNCSSLIWLDLNSNLLNGSMPETLSGNSGHIVAGNVSGKNFAFIRNEYGSACRGAGGLLEFGGIRPEQLNKTPMLRSCEYTRVYYGITMNRFQDNGSLIYLDLSYNSLSGNIPETFGSMYYIEVLGLAHNQISGQIPSSLGNMKELAVIDLSHNNLHGFIPGSLGGLSFLTDLDVSNNNLSGPIPSAGQLMTFPASKYANNSGLCGLPLPACGSLSVGDSSAGADAEDSNHHSSGSNRRNETLAASIALGLVLAMLCVAGLIYILARSRKEKKQEEMRDRYMDSLPTSGSGSWKLSGVAEPLSINVATFEKPLRKLTFAHLLEATNGFSAESLIGSGGFGDVYKAQLKDGTVVAIKKLIRVSGQGDREFTAEMETIGKIKHRNLVPLLGYCKVGDERLLVYEYMKWGSLDTVLHDREQGSATLDWAARKKIAIGSARGLAFLHHSCIPHIIHRDMKSSNVLLDEDMEPRVSDFGMARLMSALDTHLSVSSLAGTPGYVPPEYYQSFRCTTKGDVYSYGVILLELLSGRRPTDSETFGDNNLVGWMKHNVKLKKASLVFDPVLMQDTSRSSSIDMDLYHHLRIACQCLDDCPWRRPTMIQVMAMFRDAAAAAADPEAEADLDIITLPEDLDDDVHVREESSSSLS